MAGQFEGVVHATSGTARIVVNDEGKPELRFTDFATRAAPELRLYVVPDGNSARMVDLGLVKSARGDQSYALPASFDAQKTCTVVVWCETCASPFGRAKLKLA